MEEFPDMETWIKVREHNWQNVEEELNKLPGYGESTSSTVKYEKPPAYVVHPYKFIETFQHIL